MPNLAQAIRARADVSAIERKGVRVTARLSSVLREKTLHAYKTGHPVFVQEYLLRNMVPVTKAAMLAAHLRGYKQSFVQAKPHLSKALKLSRFGVFDSTIEILRKQLSLDIDHLEAQYQTHALRVLQDVSTNVEKELRKAVNKLIERGAHQREALKELNEAFEAQGISPKNDYQLEAIFRTQSQMAYSAGRWQADQDPAIQEILWGYTYSTVGDDRVREEHDALDGVTLPKDDSFWQRYWTPNGWNCRCQVISVFEERAIIQPSKLDDGSFPQPDKGFNFNPGEVFMAA